MASKHPSRLLDDPPSASPSQDHKEEEEMEVPEESEPETSEVEGSEKEDEGEGFDTDDDNFKNSPQSTPKNQSSDESSEDEEEVAETDDDTTTNSPQNTPQITKPSQTSKKQSLNKSSEKEEGFESDEDITKNSPTASSFIVKADVHKNNHPKKTTVKRALIDAEMEKVLPKKTKVAKDHCEDDKGGTTKRAGRVWSEADEISVLAGMIDYKKEKGAEPHADMGAFLEYVKGRFGFGVTKTQLYEKVRRLKTKFFTNLDKGEKFILTKPHDLECFKLSKKIWGGNVDDSVDDVNEMIVDDGIDHNENVNIVDGVWVAKNSASKSKSSEPEPKKKVQKKKKGSENSNKEKTEMNDVPKIAEELTEPVTKEDVSKDKEYVVNNDENAVKDNGQTIALDYPNLVASFSMYTESQRKLMMDGICLVDNEKARELEDSWKQLSIKETEFHCRRMELLAEQSRLVVDAWKKKCYILPDLLQNRRLSRHLGQIFAGWEILLQVAHRHLGT